MNYLYISIEKNHDIFELYKNLWSNHGINGIMVDSMTEGIKKAIAIEKSTTDELCFIAIVAGDIDYLPQLKILSTETNVPILIASFEYNEDEHHEALNNGADFYGQYIDAPEKNIRAVLSVMNNIEQRSKKRKAPNKIIIHEDVLIVDGHNKVFVKDKEIHLTGAEMKIFKCLTANRGNIVSHKQINIQIREHNPDELTPASIYSAIKRLRCKLLNATQHDYIETVRYFGYRLRAATK